MTEEPDSQSSETAESDPELQRLLAATLYRRALRRQASASEVVEEPSAGGQRTSSVIGYATTTIADPAREPEESSETALASVKLRQQEMKLKHQEQLLELRRTLAANATKIVIVQLLAANFFFAAYLAFNIVRPEPAIMVAWLSATVVEVIGILWVIARSLFPFRDKSPGGPKNRKQQRKQQRKKK
ncbi:hypothetical protein ACF1AJ_06265 [Leifsonia sp. NPDC014704]|uniref:hypothetical protein n=1 Tax=Leifsonia sp. NPDC014704 TaxID=3364123 RepID=UPI0036F451F8